MAQASRRLALASRAVGEEGEAAFGELTDDELMLHARDGNTEAFDTLVRRHQRKALRVAFRYLGETSRAADAVQNAFVALYRGVSHYKACGKFSAFFYRVLLNQCRMARRSAATESRVLIELWSHGEPEARQAPLEQRRDVEAAVRELSPKLRDVVLLRFGADLGHDEIAETLDIPVGTAKRRLFVAMAKLRQTLEAT